MRRNRGKCRCRPGWTRPGTLCHVIIRGIEKRRIVDDDMDRRDIVSRLGKLASETGTAIYARALMSNRARKLLRANGGGAAGRPINIGYFKGPGAEFFHLVDNGVENKSWQVGCHDFLRPSDPCDVNRCESSRPERTVSLTDQSGSSYIDCYLLPW